MRFSVQQIVLFLSVYSMHCQVSSQDMLRGKLVKGKYDVGFKQIAFSKTQMNSSESYPFIMNMWYPAKENEIERITFDRYINFDIDGLEEKFKRKLHRYNKRMVRYYGFEKRINVLTPREIIAFQKWKKTETLASENAPEAEGIFPLIIYHQGLGASVADNQAFFEHLSSHGFVVCNTTYHSPGRKLPEVRGSPVISIPNMDLLIETARQEKFVHPELVGLMGHSVGATMSMLYPTRGAYKVSAIILYDQGINYEEGYTSGDFWLNAELREILRNVDKFTSPILYTGSNTSFLAMDSLLYSQRTYMRVAQVQHEDFTSCGVTGRRFQKHNQTDSARVQIILDNYEKLMNYSTCFLIDHLQDEGGLSSNELKYPDLPKDQFSVWHRNAGENPSSGGDHYKKMDSTKLMQLIGRYELNYENRKIELFLDVKDGELFLDRTKETTFKRNGKVKKTEEWDYDRIIGFLSDEQIEFKNNSTDDWGIMKFDDFGNCLGFTGFQYSGRNWQWNDLVFYKRVESLTD